MSETARRIDATRTQRAAEPERIATRPEHGERTERIDLDELAVRARRLDSGRSLEVQSRGDGTDHLLVRGVDGLVELEVTLTEKGPVLHFRAAEMRLESQGKLALRGAELDLRAERGITQQAGGDFTQRIHGDAKLQVRGDLRQKARSTEIRSYLGDVRIEANDDVEVRGERVKLNP